MSQANSARRPGKTKIKPPKNRQPESSKEATWELLAKGIREIHNHNVAKLSFEENYRYAYNLVLYRNGDMLYNGVVDLITENLKKLAKEQILPAFPTRTGDVEPMTKSQEGERLLKALRAVWDDHISSMNKLKEILKYMDRVHTQTANVLPIFDAGLKLFLQHIIRSRAHPIQQHFITTFVNQIQVERDGFTINRSAARACVDFLVTLTDDDKTNVYKRELEPQLLAESDAFYLRESQILLESCDAPEFLRRVEARLESEETRTHNYLSLSTLAPLRSILESRLLTPNLLAVLSMPDQNPRGLACGLDAMIDRQKYNDLARLYRLFTSVPTGLPELRKALKQSIAARGKIVNAAEVVGEKDKDGDEEDGGGKGKAKDKGKPKSAPVPQVVSAALKWVQDVLDVKDTFDLVLKRSFDDDKGVQTSINEAFETFININPKAPEYISLFIDDNLKKGLKGKTDEEVDLVLDKTISIFRFVSEKDAFERYYKSHLAKRLLLGRSVSDDAERGMLAKLKIECGFQFTQKLEGMFHDMKISADNNALYKTHVEKSGNPALDLTVIVMTSTFWPMSHSGATCNLPQQLIRATESFQHFYLSRHSGRRLTWQPSLGNADVRATFKARTHDLNVSTFALVILLLFQDIGDDEFMTYEEIKNATQIPETELQRNLQSLACAKYKILKKHPPSRDVSTLDSFSFNIDFTAPLQRIKISTVAAKIESGEERKETMERIEEERKHQTEACIVRVMKDRKVMTHNDLINETTRQLASRFQPSPGMIKKRIESLIDREFLERRPDKKSYNYVA